MPSLRFKMPYVPKEREPKENIGTLTFREATEYLEEKGINVAEREDSKWTIERQGETLGVEDSRFWALIVAIKYIVGVEFHLDTWDDNPAKVELSARFPKSMTFGQTIAFLHEEGFSFDPTDEKRIQIAGPYGQGWQVPLSDLEGVIRDSIIRWHLRVPDFEIVRDRRKYGLFRVGEEERI
jgi:hypothetical protein